MEFESKILSKSISEMLYNSEKSLATAESCTGGRIAEAIIAVPGASNYFKGGVVSYTNEVKENLLGVDHDVLEQQTAVCEEVARQMVLGAIRTLHVDYAISATGVAVLLVVHRRYLSVPYGWHTAARMTCAPSSWRKTMGVTSIWPLLPIQP